MFGRTQIGLTDFKFNAVKFNKKMCVYTWEDVTRFVVGIPPQYGCIDESLPFKNIFNKKFKNFTIYTKNMHEYTGRASLKLRHTFYKIYGGFQDLRCIIFLVNSKDQTHLIDNLSGESEIEYKYFKNDKIEFISEDTNENRIIKLKYSNYCEYHRYGFSGICYKYDLWNILRDKDIPTTMPLVVLCNNGTMKFLSHEVKEHENDMSFTKEEISDLLGLSAKISIYQIKHD